MDFTITQEIILVKAFAQRREQIDKTYQRGRGIILTDTTADKERHSIMKLIMQAKYQMSLRSKSHFERQTMCCTAVAILN